jgi:IS5 family transposase
MSLKMPSPVCQIIAIKRRSGLNRCRYKADAGMLRWVALGVISDNLVNMGRVMSRRTAP